MSESTYLEVKWSISRGRDTYGYNIVTLTDTTTGKRYRCMGGGYDMTGTVFGQWLEDVHQDELTTLTPDYINHYREDGSYGGRTNHGDSDSYFYGLTFHDEPSRIDGDSAVSTFRRITARLDGAAGFESMRRVAQAVGLTVTGANRDRNGNARGYLVERAS